MDLILVRHTTLNIETRICYGQSDILPSVTFPEEAESVKLKLEGIKPDKVCTSPLKRCVQLAEACGYNNAEKDNRLLELDFGDWELVNWDNIYGEYAQKWMENYFTWPAPNGECLEDMLNRLKDFLVSLKNTKYKTVLCFTHSGPIRIFHHLLDNLPQEDLFKIEIDYGGIYKFKM